MADYTCSVCGAEVVVVPQGLGVEPEKRFSCGHDTAMIYADRQVVLRGQGGVAKQSGAAG